MTEALDGDRVTVSVAPMTSCRPVAGFDLNSFQDKQQVLDHLGSFASDVNATQEVDEVPPVSDVTRNETLNIFDLEADNSELGATQKVAVVILSEDTPDDDVEALAEAAEEARSRGVEVLAVTIGSKSISRDFRHAADHVIRVHRAGALRKVVDELVTHINQSCARKL